MLIVLAVFILLVFTICFNFLLRLNYNKRIKKIGFANVAHINTVNEVYNKNLFIRVFLFFWNFKKLVLVEVKQLKDDTEIELIDINLRDEFEYVIKNNQNILDDNKVSIENNVDKNIIVDANKLLLGELISNLITNAVKYTPGEVRGTIVINANGKKDVVTVSVKDTGVGLTKEQNKKIESLSKGYRQRVGLAHAILHDPEVLILDADAVLVSMIL